MLLLEDERKILTKTVHGGEEEQHYGSSLVPAISQTSTFTFSSLEEFSNFKNGKHDSFE